MKRIYLDNAATTPVDHEVVEAMLPYFNTCFGNPASLHSYGKEASEGIEKARESIAYLIGAQEKEIIFTAGGTESNNMALKGVAFQLKKKGGYRGDKGPHIITTMIEHPGVLETCRYLESYGFNVEYLPVDSRGKVNLETLENAISKETFLISVIFGNNEIGTLQPIQKIGKLAHDYGILFHTDAVQAVGKENINVHDMNIDMLSLSAHKMYGPKGIGALFLREDISLEPVIHGGGHQRGLRSGTENTPGIVGLGKACELAQKRMPSDIPQLKKMRDSLIRGVLEIEETFLNGHPTQRLVNNTHFRFTGIEGESLLIRLDCRGIAASTGSACSSKKETPSHVLKAIGLNELEAQGALRLTLGRKNTSDEIHFVLDVLPGIISELREISPVWKMTKK
jgi:cysteine desulfurase